MKVTFLIASLALSCRVYGRNDWSNACLKGTCSYDIEESPTSMGGTIKIVLGIFFLSYYILTEVSQVLLPHIGHHLCGRVADFELYGQHQQSDDPLSMHGRKHGMRAPFPGECTGYRCSPAQ